MDLFGVRVPMPPGYHFNPTEEELVSDFLFEKIFSHTFQFFFNIPEFNVYHHGPKELTDICRDYGGAIKFYRQHVVTVGQGLKTKLYFDFGLNLISKDLHLIDRGRSEEGFCFISREHFHHYWNAPYKVAGDGYWMLIDPIKHVSPIFTRDSLSRGLKKKLHFYQGLYPDGQPTSWKMLEYSLLYSDHTPFESQLDDWGLCRIYNKRVESYSTDSEDYDSEYEDEMTLITIYDKGMESMTMDDNLAAPAA